MGLSNELISQFAKVINGDKVDKKETTLRGTTVVVGDETYVRFDGSDILTPVTTTADVRNEERVTVMIKDHTATITGNSSSPSARTGDVEEIGKQVSEFEIVIADKVSTKQLEAQVGRIDDLVSENITVKERLTAGEASIGELEADNVTINEKLTANDAAIKTLESEKITADFLVGKYATIENLEATNADVHNLQADYGDIELLVTESMLAVNADIDNLRATKLSAEDADMKYATIEDLDAETARINSLNADVADIDTLIFGSASGEVIQTSFANAVIAQLGDAQIKSAMIESISASQIMAGDIITNNVRVMSEDGSLIISDETIQISDGTRVRVQIGKDGSNDYSINIWDASGNLMFSEGGITDSAIKNAIIRNDMVSEDANISASKLDISSLFTEINESTETIKSTKIYLDDKAQTLDVAFTSLSSDVDDISGDVSSQGAQITVIQNQITSKIWQQDIDEATGELSTQYSTLEQEVDGISATVASHATEIAKKADSSTVTTVSDRVASVEASLDGFKSTVSETYAEKSDITNAINDIEIGSRNLLRNTRYMDKIPTMTTIEIVRDDEDFGVATSPGSESLGFTQRLCFADVEIPTSMVMNKTVTLSLEVRSADYELINADDTMGIFIGLYSTPADSGVSTKYIYKYFRTDTDFSDSWKKLSWTLLINEDAFNAGEEDGVIEECIAPYIYNYSTYRMDFRKVKLEIGSKPTDWSPAPEDMATTEEVTSLATRVASAETSIIQNSEQIVLKATKTDITNAINDIEIGSRNLLRNTRYMDKIPTMTTIEIVRDDEDFGVATSPGSDANDYSERLSFRDVSIPSTMIIGKTVTLSFEVRSADYELINADNTMGACGGFYTTASDSNGTLSYTTHYWWTGFAYSDSWQKISWTVDLTEDAFKSSSGGTVTIGDRTSIHLFNHSTYRMDFRKVKLEIGSKPTDWSPAPEDMATTEEVETAQTAADDAQSTAVANDTRISTAELAIDAIQNAISTLIIDENGQSAMTQTSDGWVFNISDINGQLSDVASVLNDLSHKSDTVDELIENLNGVVDDLGAKTAYINMITDSSGNPCIELGKSDNDFKVRITNTAVEFLEGSSKIAYVSNKALYIERAIIKNELQIGEGTGFVWKKRSNNNMGLRWVGG